MLLNLIISNPFIISAILYLLYFLCLAPDFYFHQVYQLVSLGLQGNFDKRNIFDNNINSLHEVLIYIVLLHS